jgi:Trypsin
MKMRRNGSRLRLQKVVLPVTNPQAPKIRVGVAGGMNITRVSTALASLLLLVSGGCTQRTENPPDAGNLAAQAPSAPVSRFSWADPLPDGGSDPFLSSPRRLPVLEFDDDILRLAGPVDIENRYPATVMVAVQPETTALPCSGVVIHPRLVLTAGHCVCEQRERALPEGKHEAVIDDSKCAASAKVTTVIYKPPRNPGSDHRWGTGEVHPHPDLNIVLGAQREVISSTADLAVILLDEPLSADFRPVPLAEYEVEINDFVTIAGYGYDEIASVFSGDRRFSKNKVLKFADSGQGRVLIEQPGRHLYRLDSGGPCLREAPHGATLVGVSSRSLGEGAAFTSIIPYLAWLRAQLRSLEKQP